MTAIGTARDDPYAIGADRVRGTFERGFFAETVPALLSFAGGGRLLDLGCGDSLALELVRDRLERYVGVDLHRRGPAGDERATWIEHDLHDGLGPVGGEPFDVYFGGFGVASHLHPAALGRLLREIAAHARPGSIVGLEALGLYSIEWPALWFGSPGPARTLPYRLASDVAVHPWSARELRALFAGAGLDWLWTADRSVQAGPKVGANGYWPELPPLREAVNALLEGDHEHADTLAQPLPALPSHPAARVHQRLASSRRRLAAGLRGADPQLLAHAVWSLERGTHGGHGHGVIAVGRVP